MKSLALVFLCSCLAAPRAVVDPMSRSALIESATPQHLAWAFDNCQLEDTAENNFSSPTHADFYPHTAFSFIHLRNYDERFSNLDIVSSFGKGAYQWFFACQNLPALRDDSGLQGLYAPIDTSSPAITLRLRPVLPTAIEVPKLLKFHHNRAQYEKGEPAPASPDASAFVHPGSIFATFTANLPSCLRDALHIGSNGEPQVAANQWVKAQCPTHHYDATQMLEVAWYVSGDASLYWHFLGLDGPPRASQDAPRKPR